jgi:hypothetical protein
MNKTCLHLGCAFFYRATLFLIAHLFFANFACAQLFPKVRNAGSDEGAVECSIFETAYLNAIGIKSGDVLVEISSNFDTVRPKGDGKGMEGVFRTTESKYRCVFDMEEELFCMITQTGPNRFVDMADQSRVSKNESATFGGWVLDYQNEKLFFAGREDPVPWRLTGGNKLSEVLTRFEFLDPRLSYDIPRRGLIDDEQGHVRILSSGKKYWKKEIVGENRLILTLFDGKYDDGNEMQIWEFDLKNSLPLSYTENAWHAKNERFYPGRKRTMAWTSVNDYDVLSKMTWDDFLEEQSVDGKRYFGCLELVVTLHWYTVNQKVDNRFFDGSLLRNQADLRKCLELKTKSNDNPTGKKTN